MEDGVFAMMIQRVTGDWPPSLVVSEAQEEKTKKQEI
jgi:hypothetical protein